MQENIDLNTEISGRIKQVIDYYGITASEFSKKLGYKRTQSIYDFINGKVKPSFEFFNMFAKSELSDGINLHWLITGQGEMMLNEDLRRGISLRHFFEKAMDDPETPLKVKIQVAQHLQEAISKMNSHHEFKSIIKELSNAEELPLANETNNLEIIKREDGTEFRHLGDERYLMITPLIEQYAYAGYASGWGDPLWLDELPRHAVVVEKIHFGIYRSFTAKGDSMDNGSIESIADGHIVTGRSIDKKYWNSKLHFHKFKDFVIHHTDGLMIKRIVAHDVENGILTYSSLNPDKDRYPDTEVSLSEINELYNIVSVTQRRT